MSVGRGPGVMLERRRRAALSSTRGVRGKPTAALRGPEPEAPIPEDSAYFPFRILRSAARPQNPLFVFDSPVPACGMCKAGRLRGAWGARGRAGWPKPDRRLPRPPRPRRRHAPGIRSPGAAWSGPVCSAPVYPALVWRGRVWSGIDSTSQLAKTLWGASAVIALG